jgi:hypothetical protein
VVSHQSLEYKLIAQKSEATCGAFANKYLLTLSPLLIITILPITCSTDLVRYNPWFFTGKNGCHSFFYSINVCQYLPCTKVPGLRYTAVNERQDLYLYYPEAHGAE